MSEFVPLSVVEVDSAMRLLESLLLARYASPDQGDRGADVPLLAGDPASRLLDERRQLVTAVPRLADWFDLAAAAAGHLSTEDPASRRDALVAALEADAAEPPTEPLDPDRSLRWRLAWQGWRREVTFEGRLRVEKLASLRRLAYGASHEINNPLANIATRAQTLLADERVGERRHKLAAIAANALRAHEMIADLMLFARPPLLEPRPFVVGEWIPTLMPELLAHAAHGGSTLDVDWPAPATRMHGDPVSLAVLVGALVRNAAEALGVGGTIRVALTPLSDSTGSADAEPTTAPLWWRLSVTDDGPGVTDALLASAFDPFHSGREAGRGLGFGLSKCWVIARAHGGSIALSRGDQAGTIVSVRLPIGGRGDDDRSGPERPSPTAD